MPPMLCLMIRHYFERCSFFGAAVFFRRQRRRHAFFTPCSQARAQLIIDAAATLPLIFSCVTSCDDAFAVRARHATRHARALICCAFDTPVYAAVDTL